MAFTFTFFPLVPIPAPNLMNWNILIYGVSVTCPLLYYAIWARKQYISHYNLAGAFPVIMWMEECNIKQICSL